MIRMGLSCIMDESAQLVPGLRANIIPASKHRLSILATGNSLRLQCIHCEGHDQVFIVQGIELDEPGVKL